MTTLAVAIKTATHRSHITPFGHSWQVSSYDGDRRAWYHHNASDWDRARNLLRETRIRDTLIEMGLDVYEAGAAANEAAHDAGDWCCVARRVYRAMRP